MIKTHVHYCSRIYYTTKLICNNPILVNAYTTLNLIDSCVYLHVVLPVCQTG